MYLAQLTIRGFRRIQFVVLKFEPTLNVIVGPNNIGKSAVVDALRALLAGADDPYPRFDQDDLHLAKDGSRSPEIAFEYIFRDLNLDDEADFLHALRPGPNEKFEAVLGVTYGDVDKVGRLRPRRWCGEYDEVAMTSDMLENLRSVYLPPLRDAAMGLKPGRTSQLSRLLQLLADEPGKNGIAVALTNLDLELKKHPPLVDTQNAIVGRHKLMLGEKLAQALEIGLSASDFQKLASRLSLIVDAFEIESNGLGYNNLIFMAVVLSELAKNADSSFRGLIVEEPEAHLHPQLQAVLLRYLSNIESSADERPVQVFVTSHSPNFASIARLESVVCLMETEGKIEAFHPRSVKFGKGKREKLERYLDVTRAELFFARRVIFVEGAAELLMVNLLARALGVDLRDHGVSLISVEGLNFDSFLPLFGESAIKVPAAVLTDADPQKIVDADGKLVAHYPKPGEKIIISANTKAMKSKEDKFVKVFHGLKTFEYDFALHEVNRGAMLAALKEIHPIIGDELEVEVAAAIGDNLKARTIFRGMFERSEGNVQKGKFSQALASKIVEEKIDVVVPDYIASAVKHVSSL